MVETPGIRACRPSRLPGSLQDSREGSIQMSWMPHSLKMSALRPNAIASSMACTVIVSGVAINVVTVVAHAATKPIRRRTHL